MVIVKLNPINKDDLKVGDVVGVAREIRCGWGTSFRHVMVYPVKIIRMTPKPDIFKETYEEVEE